MFRLSSRSRLVASLLSVLVACSSGGSAELSGPGTAPTTVVADPAPTSSTEPSTAPLPTARTIESVDQCSAVPESIGLPEAGSLESDGPVTIFFEAEVTVANRERVRKGLAAGQRYLADQLGGFRFPEPICVDVRAGGSGSSTVGVVYGANHIVLFSGARPLVGAPGWLLSHVAAHELVHFWQKDTGTPRDGAGPVWLLEGAAELLGYGAVTSAGLATEGETRNYSLRRVGPETPSLESMEQRPDDPAQFSYSLSFLATELLTGERGPTSLRDYWRALSRGRAWESAFSDAFGVGHEEFYARFRVYRERGYR